MRVQFCVRVNGICLRVERFVLAHPINIRRTAKPPKAIPFRDVLFLFYTEHLAYSKCTVNNIHMHTAETVRAVC